MKKALITGITGQDGSFLAEFLLEKGYDVHGTIRRSSVDYRERIAHLEGHSNFHLHYADLGDSMSLIQVVSKVRPDEVYNLAAQSHVQVSFDAPEFTADVDATGVLRILEAVRQCGLASTCRIYQASTSELYAAKRRDPVPPLQPVRSGQALRILDSERIPRGLQYVLLLGHTFQPRERTPRRDLRHPQNHTRSRTNSPRQARQAIFGQPLVAARLGLCQGLCGMYVAHLAKLATRRFRNRHRRATLGARILPIGLPLCRHRIAL